MIKTKPPTDVKKPHFVKFFLLSAVLSGLSACSTAPLKTAPPEVRVEPVKVVAQPVTKPDYTTKLPILPKANSGRGGYYKDDGPGENPPPLDLYSMLDPIPKVENFSRSGNKPYVVFGKTYTPLLDMTSPLKQRGIASWYGNKFHGQKTSSGELYDMYKITAAHPTLPIPSYARVTNLANGKQIIVRINDRGPFHSNRIIDLSFTAALKLDYLGKGSGMIEVERLLPEDIAKMAENRNRTELETGLLENPMNQDDPLQQFIDSKQQSQAVALQTASASQTSSQITSKTAAAATPQAALMAQTERQAHSSGSQSGEQTATAANFYIQFGAFALRANAEASVSRLKDSRNLPAIDILQQGNLYRVISGPFASRSEASAVLQQNPLQTGAVLFQR